jgi:hypothetical protein
MARAMIAPELSHQLPGHESRAGAASKRLMIAEGEQSNTQLRNGAGAAQGT